jgi:hypothetical protein
MKHLYLILISAMFLMVLGMAILVYQNSYIVKLTISQNTMLTETAKMYLGCQMVSEKDIILSGKRHK